LDAAQQRRSNLFVVYPAQVASQAASLLVSLSLMPLAADRTRVRWTMSAFPGDLDGDTISARIALWDEVNREDRLKLEAMQGALHSQHFEGGPLAGADYEGTVRDFQSWCASQAG
jgi:phenylpropionate dioxygenase-like ring-hydroxylating dioxygenase large terminal subunit